MSDACGCGHDEARGPDEQEEHPPEKLWQVSEIRFAAVSGLFLLGSWIAGLAGAVYGHYTSYIAPELFQPLITIYVFLAATAGGHARPLGAIVGGYFVVVFMESTRFLAELVHGVSAVQAAALREIAIGVVLILIMRFRPQGLFPETNQKAPR